MSSTVLRVGIALLCVTGCARKIIPLKNASWARTATGQFLLEYDDADEKEVPRVKEALAAATPQLSRWGQFPSPVSIRIVPSHNQLEHETGRADHTWLRAWGRYDEVILQSPRTWSLFGVRQTQLNEVILHELTHALMYQLSGTAQSWRLRRIPFWFREGMASVTAEQGYRYATLEDLARHYENTTRADPLTQPEALVQHDEALTYGAAHHAFGFLLQRYGEQTVRAILGQMKDERSFPDAFETVLHFSPDTFLREFRRYVAWRGFRLGPLGPLGRDAPTAPAMP